MASSTAVLPAGKFHLAADYQRQYLHKMLEGYLPGLGTGVAWPLASKPPTSSSSR